MLGAGWNSTQHHCLRVNMKHDPAFTTAWTVSMSLGQPWYKSTLRNVKVSYNLHLERQNSHRPMVDGQHVVFQNSTLMFNQWALTWGWLMLLWLMDPLFHEAMIVFSRCWRKPLGVWNMCRCIEVSELINMSIHWYVYHAAKEDSESLELCLHPLLPLFRDAFRSQALIRHADAMGIIYKGYELPEPRASSFIKSGCFKTDSVVYIP